MPQKFVLVSLGSTYLVVSLQNFFWKAPSEDFLLFHPWFLPLLQPGDHSWFGDLTSHGDQVAVVLQHYVPVQHPLCRVELLPFLSGEAHSHISERQRPLAHGPSLVGWEKQIPNMGQDLMASPEPSSFPHFAREQEHEGLGANILWLEASTGPHTYLSPEHTRGWS